MAYHDSPLLKYYIKQADGDLPCLISKNIMNIESELKYKESHSVQFFTDDLAESLDLIAYDLAHIVNHVRMYVAASPDMSLTVEDFLPDIMEYLETKVTQNINSIDSLEGK